MEPSQRRILEQRRKLLLTRLATIRDFIRGSVVLMKRKCTYSRCRKCASGERHPTWVFTYSRRGKTQTAYLGQKRRAEAQHMASQFRALMGIIDQIAEINLSLLTGKSPSTKEEGEHEKPKGKEKRPRGRRRKRREA